MGGGGGGSFLVEEGTTSPLMFMQLMQSGEGAWRCTQIRGHNGKVGHGTQDINRWDPRTWNPKMCRWDPGLPRWDLGPGTSKYSNGTKDLGPPKWDLGSGTLKYLIETRDFLFQFSIVLIIYSTLNTLHFACYKTLH